jgi:pimeloyl-ACP methyl ester carboxylesterase
MEQFPVGWNSGAEVGPRPRDTRGKRIPYVPFRAGEGVEDGAVYRFILAVVVSGAALAPQSASAEYAWVTKFKAVASRTADRIGRCWTDCTDACGRKTREWARKSVDYFAPTARQEAARRCGLRLPDKLGNSQHLVILIHGLDSSEEYWQDLMPLLEQDGFAVASLVYPNDQPLTDSAALFAGEMARLRAANPRLTTDIVTHSMGGIIARAYLEGGDYTGGVERLIMLAPPNHGSSYSRFSVLCDFVEHCGLWYRDPDWSWTCMVTDGLGEARNDISPGSPFLRTLNAKARRRDVRYTVVAGNRSCGWRYAANVVRWSSVCVPNAQWTKPVDDKLYHWADQLESRRGANDGLVEIENALLPGVDDVVIVPADHTTIACVRNGRPPVAWPVIRERLAR